MKKVVIVFLGCILLTIGSANGAILTFDDLITGETSYGFDGDGDGVDDVLFTTTDPSGFNTLGPGANMTYINEPGLEGTSELSTDLRADFLVGAVNNLSFGFALDSFSEDDTATISVYDYSDTLIATVTQIGMYTTTPSGTSNFPEGYISVSFSGVATYALFNFTSDFGRYIIDNLEGEFGTTERPECVDLDGDGYPTNPSECGSSVGADCNDKDPTVNPGAPEICGDGKDNNCDGQIDEGCPTCTDADQDGFAVEGGDCGPVDCDDSNPAINPDAEEVCGDGIDNNCDGQIDEGCLIEVAVDIKPGSCPNPIGFAENKGVVPFAIMGTTDNPEFDISQIDPESIRITREGTPGEVKPIRWTYEDVATPFEGELCDCHNLMGDGYMDLSMKATRNDLVNILKLKEVAGQTVELTITGKLKDEFGGTPIKGQDCMRVLKTVLLVK